MLLKTHEIRRIESRFLSLFERTFLKGIKGKPAPSYLKSVKTQFKSKTFQIQVDKIIDSIYRHTIEHTDSQLDKQASASLRGERRGMFVSAAAKPLPITEEVARQAAGLSQDIVESIVRILKDDGLYLEHPDELERHVRDLWGGEKHRAVRFARTFTADIATNTELWRYQDAGIEELQFYAKLDDRTSPQCQALHGTIIQTNSKEASLFRPPLHHHCLVSGTKINTMEGEQNIEDVQKGTMVLTHLNNYMPVYDTMEREAEDIIEISTANRTIKITSNHPVLTKRNDTVSWIPAGELTEQDEIFVM